MKKRALTILLALCLCLSLPMAAWAWDGGSDDTVYAKIGGTSVTDDNASNVKGDSTASVKYNKEEKMLTLTNATINSAWNDGNSSDWIGVELLDYDEDYNSGGFTIVLVGQNTITVPANTGLISYDVYGIKSLGKVTFAGSGSLTISTCDSPGDNYGIHVMNDIIIDNNVTLNVTAGDAVEDSYAIYMDITGSGDDYSVDIGEKVKLTAIAGKAGGTSCGIRATNLYTSYEANVTAKGGEAGSATAEGACSYGMEVYGDITINADSVVNVTAGEATCKEGEDAESHALEAIDVYVGGNVKLTATAADAGYESTAMNISELTVSEGATLTAIAGDAKYSYGIYAYETVDIGDGAAVTAKAGDATNTTAGAKSFGIYAQDYIDICEKANVTATAGAATAFGDAESYGIVVDDGSDDNWDGDLLIGQNSVVKATGGAAKSTSKPTDNSYDADEANAYSEGVALDGMLQLNEGASLTATGGKAEAYLRAESYGVYADDYVTMSNDAVLTATGVNATAAERAESFGVYVSVGSVSNTGGKITAKAGNVEANGQALSSGMFMYNGSRVDTLYVAAGGTLTATGGSATTKGYTGRAGNYADSYGIKYYGAAQFGNAKVTATAGAATADYNAYSVGIDADHYQASTDSTAMYVYASEVKATGGKALTNGTATDTEGTAQSYGIAVDKLSISENSTVTAKADTAVALNVGVSELSDNIYESVVYSFGVYAEFVDIDDDGKNSLTATGGTATYKDGSKSGQNVSSYSGGVFVRARGGNDRGITIQGTLIATAGAAYGQYTPVDGKAIDLDVASYGIFSDNDVYVDEGANAKVTGGAAQMDTEAEEPAGAVSSSGIYISGSMYNQQGGAMWIQSGTATGGAYRDTEALSVYKMASDSNENGEDGMVLIGNGWLKVESDDTAILAGRMITIPAMLDDEDSKAVIVTPEGGVVGNIQFSKTYQTIYDGEGDDAKVASTVLIWDGTTKEYVAPATGGGSHHKKNDTTKEDVKDENKDENKDETKTDEQTGTGEFTDVQDSDYFSGAVDWASKNGITGGTTPSTFGPHESCTRGQLVTFLWRAAEKPEAEHELTFTDVKPGMYYKEAVTWAAMLEIVKGYSETEFAPDDNITREQMAAVLYRFAKAMGMDTTQGGMAAREFADWEQVSDYAKAAVQWAVNAGIMQGDNGYLLPQDACTRAQIVTMLHRLLGE